MLIPPPTPFDPRPPKAPITTTACACLGGSSPCSTVGTDCRGCGRYTVVCRTTHVTGRATSGDWYCPTCRVLPVCSQCRRTQCVCRVSAVGTYHNEAPRSLLQCLPRIVESEPLLGLELEAIYPDGPTHLGETAHAVDAIVLSHERDSSLGEAGAESVTVPLPLSLVRHAWPALSAAVAAAGGSAAHPACGAHIHITATPEMRRGADRIWPTYGTPAQAPVWDAVCGRRADAYASNAWRRAAALPTSRAAMWSTHYGTIEWRHPGGTDDPRMLVGRAELLVDVLRHAAALPADQAWGWGRYVRDRPRPTPDTAYAWALLRSIGLYT